MNVFKLEEAGYEYSLLGISLSRNQPPENMPVVAKNLSDKDGGHNKFLEFIAVWLDITAPRFWWQEMSTYRVGNSWQSESTMYTITKKELVQENFEYPIDEIVLSILNNKINEYKNNGHTKDQLLTIKNLLPEGFLQRRIMITNYKGLRNIIGQRINHRLPQWQYFCNTVLNSLDHPEFIVPNYEKSLTDFH
jgi:hypothetical protein